VRFTVYAITGVDHRGRAADVAVVEALGWTSATCLDAYTSDGAIIIRIVPQGPLRLTARGHVRIPAPTRRACGIEPGDRVLLAAEPEHGALFVYPLASLDAMIGSRHAVLMAGGAA
jgi:hypothetical protein